MRSKAIWLLALLLTPLLVPQVSPAAESALGGKIEAGVYGQDISEDGAKVGEYSGHGDDATVTGYGAIDLHGASATTAVDLSADVAGSDGPQVELKFDANRILRFKGERNELTHRLGHDRIDYLNAAVPAPPAVPAGTTIVLSPDSVPAAIVPGSYNPATGTVTTAAAIAPNQQIGRASVYGEDFVKDQVFEITRKESKADADLALPFLPNIVFHAGYRLEEREGTEQSIGMSKCTACHVTGGSREVNEQTDEFRAGATGRFGLLSFDYAYKGSEFREKAAAPTRVYDPALAPAPSTLYTAGNAVFDNRLLYDYEDGALVYDQTPDSEKQSHVLKARVDLAKNTTFTGSFVNSESKSRKQGETGIWGLADAELESTYDGYGFRLSSKVTDWFKVLVHGKHEQVETDDAVITFYPAGTTAQPNLGGGTLPASITNTYESVESRDVVTLGADTVWRLARKTSLKIGYEYKADDRDSDDYGKTTKQTAEATLKTVLGEGVSLRAGYTYQDIDDPFMHANAAGYVDPFTGLTYTTDPTANLIGSGPLYGTAFYDQRQTDLSNLPETVHEAKVSSTWAPAANFAATLAARYRNEGNELARSEWKQQTLSPSLSFWYAPAQQLNLTFAYNYLGQRAESRFCQGWYDG
jgi:hypothetical protein